MSNDVGGITAISGFLFQVMVAAGLKASAELTEVSQDGTKLGGLIRLAKTANIFFESFDQDIALRAAAAESRKGLTLIQVKYSKKGSSIGPKEMKDDIYPAFNTAWQAAKHAGEECAGFLLITNRGISDRLKSRLSTKGKTLLKDLQIFSPYDFNLWQEYVAQFGQEYGLTLEEIENGVASLLGRVLVKTQRKGGNYQITTPDLLKTVAGDGRAVGLIRAKAIAQSRENVKDFDGAAKGNPIPREVLDTAMPHIENRALIVFEGVGGTGKTAVLREWARSIADADLPSLPFVNILSTDFLTKTWIPNLVTGLNPALHPPDEGEAISRFRIANPLNSGPLLHLGLDGIDDRLANESAFQAVKQVVRKFIQEDKKVRAGTSPLECRLVVTCRSFDDFCADMKLSPSGSDDDEVRGDVLRLRFDYFSEEELRKLVALNCKDLAPHIFPSVTVLGADRKYGSLEQSGSFDWNRSAIGGDVESESLEKLIPTVDAPVDPKYVNILCDPVIWREFLGLTPPERKAWLKGDSGFEHRMTEAYLARFTKKARDRVGTEIAVLHRCLREVAVLAGESAQYRTRGEWITWACSSNLMTDPQAGKLYEEAASGGLILRDSELKWHWRSDLLSQHLRMGATS